MSRVLFVCPLLLATTVSQALSQSNFTRAVTTNSGPDISDRLAAAINNPELIDDVADVIEGMTQGFFGRSIPRPQKDCVTNSLGALSQVVMRAAVRVVELSEQVFEPEKTNLHHQDGETNIEVLRDLRIEIIDMVHLQGRLMANCARNSTMDVLKLAGNHLKNLTYVGGRFVANGAAIVSEVSDAIIAFKARNYFSFGSDIGKMWRRVLLSKAHREDEVQPTPAMIEAMSWGALEGFFGPNSYLVLTSDDTPLSLRINLHSCITQNLPFLQSVWNTLMLFIAQLAIDDLPPNVQQAWQANMAAALIGLPTAMRQCNIDAQEEEMLSDSLRSLHFDVQLPQDTIESRETSMDLAHAIRDWTKGEWRNFGADIGHLLQEFVIAAFPQMYSVDAARSLRRELDEVRVRPLVVGLEGGPFASPALVLGAAAVALLAMAVVLRARRVCRQWRREGLGSRLVSGVEVAGELTEEDPIEVE